MDAAHVFICYGAEPEIEEQPRADQGEQVATHERKLVFHPCQHASTSN